MFVHESCFTLIPYMPCSLGRIDFYSLLFLPTCLTMIWQISHQWVVLSRHRAGYVLSFGIRHRTVLRSIFVPMFQRSTSVFSWSCRQVSRLQFAPSMTNERQPLQMGLRVGSAWVEETIPLHRRMHRLWTSFSCGLVKKLGTRANWPFWWHNRAQRNLFRMELL